MQLTQTSCGVEPKATILQPLSQTIKQYTLLLFKVFYNIPTETQGVGLQSILCDLNVNSSTVSIDHERTDVVSVMRSGSSSLYQKIFVLLHMLPNIIFLDFCECRQGLSGTIRSGSGSGDNKCLEPQTQLFMELDIQELCNGTLASPCDCTSSSECQVGRVYVSAM